jgi:hypothetical protein
MGESATLIAAVLSVASGWMLIRRHRWAPQVTSLSGGALFVLTLYWLWSVGPLHVRVVVHGLPTASYWRMGVTYGTELLVMVLQLVSWLITLGALYRHRGGTEFPPARFELTTANLDLDRYVGAGHSFLQGLDVGRLVDPDNLKALPSALHDRQCTVLHRGLL